jgi:3,4-dihydroxy 2-butanone 4-phosphate synthase/GTP cyclohydrolase II
MFHAILEAMTDLKQGKPVIVVDDEDRENEGDFLALSEKVTPEMINFMITHGKGLVCMPITRDLAVKMNLSLMEKQNTDPFGTAFTVSVDHVDTTTGISAWERAATIKAFTNAEANPQDFKRPGHIFPLIAEDGGVLSRPGHTEAAVDLARLCGSFPSGVICEIIKGDGTMARVPDLEKIAEEFDLKMINIQELIEYRKRQKQHA